MKKFTFIILIIIGFNYNILFAQKQGQEKIDAILKKIDKSKEDTNKVNLLNSISVEYYSINPETGIKYCEQAYQLAVKLNWKSGIANSTNTLGIYHWSMSNYPKALNYFFKSLKICESKNDKYNVAGILVNIGLIYSSQADYVKALEFYFRALKTFEELGDKSRIASNFVNIGNIYWNIYDYSKALEYFFKALKLDKDLGDKSGLAVNYSNIGMIYCDQANYNKALEYNLKSLKTFEELGDKRRIAEILGNIGSVYLHQENYTKAIEYFFDALKREKEFGSKKGYARNLGNIGVLYMKLSRDTIFNNLNEKSGLIGLTKEINFQKGMKYSLEAVKMSEEIGDLKFLIELYRTLYEGYKRLDNPVSALKYHELFKKTQDSVFNLENSKKFASLETKRESELKEKEIEILKANQRRQDAEINSTRWQLIGSFSVIILLVGFSIIVIRERRKSEQLLLNILPLKIAKRLKAKEHPIADSFDSASIVFIDIVDFTKTSAGTSAKRVAEVLNLLYSQIDKIAKKHGLEKIKTIGDCFMAAAGIPDEDSENARKAANFALETMSMLKDYDTGDGTILKFRCGVDCGPVVAGVIGENKFIYDVWGDTVNTASRMEAHGVIGKIQCTERFANKLTIDNGQLKMKFVERGEIEIKGKGLMKTYFLVNNE